MREKDLRVKGTRTMLRRIFRQGTVFVLFVGVVAVWMPAASSREPGANKSEGTAEQTPAGGEKSPAADAYAKGSEAFGKGDTDAAIALFDQAVQLDPKDAPAYCDRGLARAIKGDWDKALGDLDTAIRLDPNGARSYFNRGYTYFRKEEYEKATADYTEAIRLYPKYAAAYRDRGYIPARCWATWNAPWPISMSPLGCRRKTPRSLPVAEKPTSRWAIRITPSPITIGQSNSNHETRKSGRKRATAHAMRGDYDAAVADATQAMKLCLREPAPYFARGFAYRKQGDPVKALADLDEAIRLKPQFGEAYRERGHAADDAKRMGQGVGRSRSSHRNNAHGLRGVSSAAAISTCIKAISTRRWSITMAR